MTPADLRAELDIELEAVGKVLAELSSLHADMGNREPTVREKTAAATFLAQFYGGIENILKRISKFHLSDFIKCPKSVSPRQNIARYRGRPEIWRSQRMKAETSVYRLTKIAMR